MELMMIKRQNTNTILSARIESALIYKPKNGCKKTLAIELDQVLIENTLLAAIIVG
jgi:hypothetical protein